MWQVDRLARRVLDFLHAAEALRERGAGLVSVEDPIGMMTRTAAVVPLGSCRGAPAGTGPYEKSSTTSANMPIKSARSSTLPP